MGRRPNGHEDSQGQRYCSECGQPMPPAAPDEGTPALHSEANETEPEAGVQLPLVSSQESPGASAAPTSAAGGPAATSTVPRRRSGPSSAVRRSGKSQPSSQPPTKQWYRRPRLVVPLSLLAVVVAVAAVGLGALLAGKSKSGATTQSPASTQSPVSTKKQSPLSKWTAENQSKSERLAKSITAVAASDVAGPYTSTLPSDCQELGDASRAVAVRLPAPNAALTDALRAAIDAFDRAAQECITGVDRRDPAALDRFRSDFETGQKQIAVVGYIVQRINKGG
jgi:hypothetical protein